MEVFNDLGIRVHFGEDSGKFSYDIVVIESDLEALSAIKKTDPRVEVIMIGEREDDAIEAIRSGAFSFFTHPIDLDMLRSTVKDISQSIEDFTKTGELEDQLYEKYIFAGTVVGKSAKMLDVFSLLRRIAPYFTSVLLTGETGTGKEVIAKALHQLSTPEEPFVVCNCGGLTESLMESLLFGHRKGAFTGATTDRKGLFEVAGEGCIFLDEVGELPLSFQPHFLRVLQDGEFRAIGDSKTRHARCRVIAATNRDLPGEVEQGSFRRDLYYRLTPLTIELPPLRDRKEDIYLLSRGILERFSSRTGKKVNGISLPAKNILMSYDWPGNVRELTNVLEQAAIIAVQPYIRPEDLGDLLARPSGASAISTLDEVTLAHIREALRLHGGNQTNAAKVLGISRMSLIRRIKKHGLNLT